MNQRRPVEPADLYRLKILQEARLSPDGKTVLYGVSHIDAEKEQEYCGLWLQSLETGKSWQFTSGMARDFNAAWSPDGQQIAFLSTRDDAPQIYLIPVHGGEPKAITSLKQGVGGGLAWSPDGKQLAFTAGPDEELPDPGKPYRVTRTNYRFDGMGYLHRTIQNIYVIGTDGQTLQQLTHGQCVHTSPIWSPDGSEILFSAMLEPEDESFYTTLKVVNLKGEVREIVANLGMGQTGNWTPDGKHIVFTGTPNGRDYGYKYDLWVVDRAGGEPVNRTASLKTGVEGNLLGDFPAGWFYGNHPVTVSEKGDYAYLHIQPGGVRHIYKVALSGPESWTAVTAGERFCALMDMDKQHVLYAVSTIQDPGNLYICDLDGKNERQFTDLNRHLLDVWELPTVEHLLFPSEDGEEVEGWILKPAVGTAPYPTVLYIHGGPYYGVGHIYFFDYQMLAGAGYAVLFINHRGSSGYGDKFSTRIFGDWGNMDYKDLMAGVDTAIAKGISDPDRLGVCGLSGGGNLSCWIVGHTDRFKAAVPENPVTNWVSMFGVSDIGPIFCIFVNRGLPHEVPETYARCSPITYAHNCKTPTLLVQAEQDCRCPVEQGEQFYEVLKANGCTVEMVRLPNSFHVGSITGQPVMRRVQNEVLLDWMNKYVLGIADGGKVASL